MSAVEPGAAPHAASLDGPSPARRRRLSIVEGSARWKLLIGGSIAVAFLLVAALAWVFPVIEARLVSRFVALGVALLGLQFVVGRAGQLSLCHGVFVGLGSYATTISVSRYGFPHLAGLAMAPVVGFAFGCLVGLLALRIRANYLGPVTLSVAVVFPMFVKRFGWFTGGSSGLPLVREMDAPGLLQLAPGELYRWNHLVIVAVAVLALIVMRNVVFSLIGSSVKAVADNALSAATSGIDVRRTRVLAYAFGAAFGALGGGLLVLDTPVVGADSYTLFQSLGYYAAVMVGGATSMLGAVIGALLLVLVPWLMESQGLRASPPLVLGGLLVLTTLVAPAGVAVAIRNRMSSLVEVRHPIEEARRAAGASPSVAHYRAPDEHSR